LLKALLREDEIQQVQYGPLDQKDSLNVFLNFIDTVTWPENLKFYLNTDPELHKPALEVLESCEYPYTGVTDKLKVLRYLTDTLLSTTAVRDDLHNEGSLPAEDHCRVCHKLGDMVICEQCNGPFHGTCLEPPMYEVPDEDWICPVCHVHMVEGVADSLSTNPGACRIQQLGTDRDGNQYWYAGRRVWMSPRVEGQASPLSEVAIPRYYSTRAQLTELMEALDQEEYEKELYENIQEIQETIESQMDITEALTKKLNIKGLKSWLEVDNMVLDKLQQERNDLREHLEAEKKKIQLEIERQIKEEEMEAKRREKEAIKTSQARKRLNGQRCDRQGDF